MDAPLSRNVEFESAGVSCAGWYYVPSDLPPNEQRPGIVMAHGWSAVKEMHLANFAEGFVKAGFVVLVFDYRGFGGSQGEPRQRAIPREQQLDYRNAITWMSTQPEVDPERIGIWGSSYSGGHVLQVAADDRRVKAVVSQIPAVNASIIPLYWMRRGWFREVWANTKLMIKQLFLPWTTQYVPVVNKPGKPATLPGEESYKWLMHASKQAPAWRNELTVSSSWAVMRFNASRYIAKIAPTPLLMVVASQDTIVITEECLKAFARAGEPKKLLQVEGGHFDVYEEPGLSRILPTEIAWFKEHL